MSTKLHLGCGSVYLKGYINIDSPKHRECMSLERFEKFRGENITTLNKYYKRPYIKSRSATRTVCADEYLDVTKIDTYYDRGTVDEIVSYQVIEHFPRSVALKTLKVWYDLLEKGGVFRVTVPDIVKTCKMINDAKNDEELTYIIRLLFGSGKSELYIHYDGFYPKKLRKILKKIGYKKILKMRKNIHSYPAFGFVCTK